MQQIQASTSAFAAILGDGSVVTWGEACNGGDSSAVQDQLKNVQQIQASDAAFAAIRGDGSIVTWGHPGYGGDSSAVQDRFTEVCEEVPRSLALQVGLAAAQNKTHTSTCDRNADELPVALLLVQTSSSSVKNLNLKPSRLLTLSPKALCHCVLRLAESYLNHQK